MRKFDPNIPEGAAAHATDHLVRNVNNTIEYQTHDDADVIHLAIEGLMTIIGQLEADNRKLRAQINKLASRIEDHGIVMPDQDRS